MPISSAAPEEASRAVPDVGPRAGPEGVQCCSRGMFRSSSRWHPKLLQRGLPEQFRKRGSSAAPGGGQSSSRGADPERLQMGGPVLLQRVGPEQIQRGSSAAPEGREHLGRPMDSTSADPACPLLRGYVLTQAIDIFHVPYPLCLLVVKPIDTPSFSTGRGRGEVAGATPLFRVSFGLGPPLQWTLRGPVQHSPRGGRSRQVIPAGRLGFRRNDPA